MASSNFVDYVKIFGRSGKGGAGSRHFRKEKFIEFGGPDGGDGGNGGSIILRGNKQYWTLIHLKYQRHIFAENGEAGSGARCSGKNGADVIIDVPLGTVARNAETGEIVCEVTEEGQLAILLKGGRGGLGNWHFKTATNQAPRYAQPGEDCVEGWFILELKVLADVGLVGFPNAGKSTLLNALLNEERAIVSDIHGTTRDVIEDTMNLGGITFRFIDTAGIRETTDTIESLGIERSFQKLDQADIVLWVIDATQANEQYQQLAEKILPRCEDKHLIIVLNKADLLDAANEDVQKRMLSVLANQPQKTYVITLSAKHKEGITLLQKKLVDFAALPDLSQNDVVVSNIRHYEALSHALESIHRVQDEMNMGLSGDFVSQDLRECLFHLAEITGGEITTDEVLGNIFRNFCIGK